MERLITLYLRYEEENVPPEVLSAWLHHRFTQIHPFQDGNGRIARAIASLVFLKAALFPLVIRDADREIYITALEEADDGKLEKLVQFFAKRQRDSILSALGIQQQVEQTKHSQQIISNAIALLSKKSRAEKDQINEIYATAAKLQKVTEKKLSEIQATLDPQLRSIDTIGNETYNASIKAAEDGSADSYFFRRQIIEMAKLRGYYANSDSYKSWTRLMIYTAKRFEVVFSIHGYGHGDNGIMVVSGFAFEKVPSEDTKSGTESTDTRPCNEDIFQFNYLEKEESILKRYEDWLDESITFALADWQRTIA
jgi:hypothetical protein